MEKRSWQQKVVEQLVEMFKDSVIIQGFMAATVVLVIAVMILQGRFELLPKEFWIMAGTIFGYYFRAKNDNQIRRIAQDAELIRAQAEAMIVAERGDCLEES